jgi:signal transduction histidine kinase
MRRRRSGSLAALERRLGRVEAAEAALRAVVERHALARDARGLLRAHAARFLLAEGADDLRALFGALVEEDGGPADLASAVLKEEVRARLAALGAAPASDDLARDAEREPLRRLRSAWEAGLGIALARGLPPGGAISFPAPGPSGPPLPLVVAARPEAEGRVEGVALLRDALVAAALERPEVRALAAGGVILAAAPATEASVPTADVIARRPLDGPFDGLALLARAPDAAAIVAADRRRVLLAGIALGAALLVALAAGLLGLRALAREVEATRAREAFVAAVSHELKAPLASIRLLAELLARGGVEEAKAREMAAHVVRESERLSRLVAGVLELARIERGERARLRRDPLDAAALAKDAIDAFAPLARERGFTVALRAPEGLPRVRGDRDALTGALVNLLDNAVKYAERPHEVLVALERAPEGGVLFSVLDRGRGVAPLDRARLFAPFSRGGDEMTRDRPGAGLGLALVRGIAEAHGGRVEYAPREGGGSVFSIRLTEEGPPP